MKLQVKSNSKIINMPAAEFDKFSKDQKRQYLILSKEDAPEEKKQITSNALETTKPGKKEEPAKS